MRKHLISVLAILGATSCGVDDNEIRSADLPEIEYFGTGAETVTIDIAVDTSEKLNGNLCVALFSSADGYPFDAKKADFKRCDTPQTLISGDQKPFLGVRIKEDLEPKYYSIGVFVDENGDETLNQNSFKLPTELFGFSTNPGLTIGPPKFDDVKIKIEPGINKVNIQLLNLLGR